MLESHYQALLIKKLREVVLPGCVVVKNPSDYMQGIPDLTVFFRKRWGMLEVKTSANASVQPNQEFYVDLFNQMSFAAFIFPENEEEVLDALQQTLQPRRSARVSKRE